MVPERLMQILKMTDLLPEACLGRTGFSKSDMGHCSGEQVRGKQHKNPGDRYMDFAGNGIFGI